MPSEINNVQEKAEDRMIITHWLDFGEKINQEYGIEQYLLLELEQF